MSRTSLIGLAVSHGCNSAVSRTFLGGRAFGTIPACEVELSRTFLARKSECSDQK